MKNEPDFCFKDSIGFLGSYSEQIKSIMAEFEKERVIERIWEHDHTLWKPDPKEISNRLGWLRCPQNMITHIDDINTFVDGIRSEGFTNCLLLGMGGSSLAPEVFRKVYGIKRGFLELNVLDSTDPGFILSCEKQLDFSKTLFIVSTKSGGTVETLSLFKYFFNRIVDLVGIENAGNHFIAITDPGSSLSKTAEEFSFRKVFLNDPHIGGRYSGLSFFGLVPAAFIGVDIKILLEVSQEMMHLARMKNIQKTESNSPAWLGLVLGELALRGRDKLTLLATPQMAPLGAWIEQLIAESTGKEGKGILPVTSEPIGKPEEYSSDRLFVSIITKVEEQQDEQFQQLVRAGFPCVQITMPNITSLGAEMFRWELATAIASWRLEVNPFDQPNVESAKIMARDMVSKYQQKGTLPVLSPIFQEKNIDVISDLPATSISRIIRLFVEKAVKTSKKSRPYIAIQAFIQQTDETDKALENMVYTLRRTTNLTTTYGYGPRFLHSTGQLHKGDSGNGLFIQITDRITNDIAIPNKPGDHSSSISFGILRNAQSLGDRQALLENSRSIIRFEINDPNVVQQIHYLIRCIR